MIAVDWGTSILRITTMTGELFALLRQHSILGRLMVKEEERQ